ncbi:MAG: multicopper oxidase family protein [Pseudomonas sp.]
MKKNRWKSMSAPPKDSAEGAARRSFLKLSAAAMAAPLLLRARNGDAVEWVTTPQPIFPPSPATRPWLEELPSAIIPIEQVSALSPAPSVTANVVGGEAGRDPHQRFAELTARFGGPELYELSAVENKEWVVHPDLPKQTVWAYRGGPPNATVPPTPDTTVPATIFARYGTPVLCRIHNGLPEDHVGFGSPEISTHLHNLHTPSESDGFPGDFYSKTQQGPTLSAPGEFKDHFYPNIYAGYDQQKTPLGDPNEALGTLWYHDHTEDFTAPNVTRGLVGFYLLFDDLDSGDERDPNGLRLPSHPYDYPLAFGDRRFTPLPDGQLFWDQLHVEGVLGDKVVVNGKIEPVLRVARRKYRLRLLNSGPSRFYEFYLVTPGNVVQRFTYIANDGNLLPEPLLNQTKVRLGVAERADLVVDFSKYSIGTELYLVNRLRQDSTRGPKDVKAPGTRVLKFIVDREPPEQDLSRVPSKLRELPPLDLEEIARAPVRRWEFDRKNGLWLVNGRLFDVNNPRIEIKQGSAEVWELVGKSGGWSHPIHIHLEEGRILSKSVDDIEVPVPPHERGRKDVFVLEQTMTMRVLLRFRDFTGKYVMHCHNVIHEDHAMMVRFDIEGEDD